MRCNDLTDRGGLRHANSNSKNTSLPTGGWLRIDRSMPPFILLVITIALAGCKKSDSAPAHGAPPPAQVEVAAVVLRDVTPADELTGRVEAIQQVDVRPRVAGYITAVHQREGAEVRAGELLFSIDARPYRAALARATAELARAKARVDLARLEAQRAETLLEANAIARAERDTAASTRAQAEAEVQAAQAAVELARLDVEYTTVRAPIAGRTGQALVSVGDYVAAGPQTLLTTLVSVDPVHVYFTADEQRYLATASGAKELTVNIGLSDEQGYPREGKVDFIDSHIDASTGTMRLRAVVANKDKRLVPGLYARVRLPERGTVKAMLVDDKAILTDQDRKYVYVLAGDTVARRDVKLGRIVDGLRVITSGLQVGDRVIVNNVQKVFPGAKAVVAAALPAAAKTGGVR
jgi:multidrug efflux system membrane fusion protein